MPAEVSAGEGSSAIAAAVLDSAQPVGRRRQQKPSEDRWFAAKALVCSSLLCVTLNWTLTRASPMQVCDSVDCELSCTQHPCKHTKLLRLFVQRFRRSMQFHCSTGYNSIARQGTNLFDEACRRDTPVQAVAHLSSVLEMAAWHRSSPQSACCVMCTSYVARRLTACAEPSLRCPCGQNCVFDQEHMHRKHAAELMQVVAAGVVAALYIVMQRLNVFGEPGSQFGAKISDLAATNAHLSKNEQVTVTGAPGVDAETEGP